jgi:hypothetical protein
MHIRKRNKLSRNRAGDVHANAKSASETPPTGRDKVPEIYQVVVECRHEREQQAVFERMRAEGYRCRVLTL